MNSAFSLTLYVGDVCRSADFYRILFDREPVKDFPEYAEFIDPHAATVFGLLKVRRFPGAAISRVAVPMPAAELDALRARLALGGIAYRDRTESLEVADPDDHQLTLFSGETPPLPDAYSFANEKAPASSRSWEHRVGHPIPERIPHEPGTLSEVLLQVTINGDYAEAEIVRLIGDAYRVLEPGGRVLVTGYVGHVAVPPPIRLPGVAGRIRRLPQEAEPATLLATAGFQHLFYELFGDIICYRIPGVDLRKIRLIGVKPGTESGAQYATYHGPFPEITLDDGSICRQGVALLLSGDACEAIRLGPAAGQFKFAPGRA